MLTRRLAAMLTAAALAAALAACAQPADRAAAPAANVMDSASPFVLSTVGPRCADLVGGASPGTASPAAGTGRELAALPVLSIAERIPQLSLFVLALQQAGLADTLNSRDPMTVFAPLGWSAGLFILLRELRSNAARARGVLRDHLVPARLPLGSFAGRYTSLGGTAVNVADSGDRMTVNDRADVECVVPASNGALVLVSDTVAG